MFVALFTRLASSLSTLLSVMDVDSLLSMMKVSPVGRRFPIVSACEFRWFTTEVMEARIAIKRAIARIDSAVPRFRRSILKVRVCMKPLPLT